MHPCRRGSSLIWCCAASMMAWRSSGQTASSSKRVTRMARRRVSWTPSPGTSGGKGFISDITQRDSGVRGICISAGYVGLRRAKKKFEGKISGLWLDAVHKSWLNGLKIRSLITAAVLLCAMAMCIYRHTERHFELYACYVGCRLRSRSLATRSLSTTSRWRISAA